MPIVRIAVGKAQHTNRSRGNARDRFRESPIPAEHFLGLMAGHVSNRVHRVGDSAWEAVVPPPPSIALSREEVDASPPLSMLLDAVAGNFKDERIVEYFVGHVATEIEATQVSG
jgi:hypothetical protein